MHDATDPTDSTTTGRGASGPSRRTVLRWAGLGGMLGTASWVVGCVPMGSGSPATDLIVRPGFTGRVIAVAGRPIGETGHTFGPFPDGASTFPDPDVPGGWFLAVNHEAPLGGGGVTSIRFAPDGTIVDAYPILEGTSINCAGGRTPWGTWLSCEEHDQGVVWECNPRRRSQGIDHRAMGVFAHEAAAVADDGRVYLTEDRPNGCWYRFTPTTPGDLRHGVLELATGSAPGTIVWRRVPDPAAEFTRCRDQVDSALHFHGAEGIDTFGRTVWFTTKGDDRVWRYDLDTAELAVHYQAGDGSVLSGVDNVLADRTSGSLVIAEDGDDMQLVAIRADGSLEAVVQVVGHDGSEMTGPTLSPDRRRMYFSSQRGKVFGLPIGVTYEVEGPWDGLLSPT
ncbi:MAG: DUF839 domain-containing protein [Microthrixaceae bacterium]